MLKQIAVVLAGILLSACSVEKLSETVFPDDVRRQLNQINEAITNRDDGAIRVFIPTTLSDEEFKAKLREVFAQLPGGAFVNRELAGFNKLSLKTVRGIDQTTYRAGYQYKHTDGWAYVEIVLMAENGNIALQTLNITRLPRSLRDLNAFTFAGKRAVHYVVFALAVLIPIFIIATFVVCYRMHNLKRRKRWLAFILFGFSGVALNWTTGAMTIKILSVSVLGAGFTMSSALAAVTLQASFPLGAVLFWCFHKSGKLARMPEPSADNKASG